VHFRLPTEKFPGRAALAELLKIQAQTLYSKMKKLGIDKGYK
jgi:DNA-binding NtrC family response regulator